MAITLMNPEGLPGAPTHRQVSVALEALLALMVGALQFAPGLLRAGFVVNFLSHAAVSGFTSAAAIMIGPSQLSPLLGHQLDAGQSARALLREVGGGCARSRSCWPRRPLGSRFATYELAKREGRGRECKQFVLPE